MFGLICFCIAIYLYYFFFGLGLYERWRAYISEVFFNYLMDIVYIFCVSKHNSLQQKRSTKIYLTRFFVGVENDLRLISAVNIVIASVAVEYIFLYKHK